MTAGKALNAVRAAWVRHRHRVAGVFIAAYLTVIGGGLFCHTFNWKTGSHPLMYFVVWDMFCGWAGHECRIHVIAEGVSGRYYQALPGPWGDVKPFGDLGRQHYDADGVFGGRMAMNVLRHTSHEEITRLFIVEENWPKKFNMPDEQWAARWQEPKDPRRYFTPRHVLTADGLLLQSFESFYTRQNNMAVAANPRLMAEIGRSRPYYALDLTSDAETRTELAGQAPALPRFGSPLGN